MIEPILSRGRIQRGAARLALSGPTIDPSRRRACAGAAPLVVLALGLAAPALAQTPGTLTPKPLAPLANPDDPGTPAKELFGRKTTPATELQPMAIGFYSKGCLAGGAQLPIDGDAWQVMRLSRNRNWGHPALVKLIEKLASKAPAAGWNGLLVGDMSQPRGGPMLTGHASHQIGLDADIWLTPAPDRRLSRREREEMSATNVVASNWLDVNPDVWTARHHAIVKLAAQQPEVERIFVNAAIKKALCREAGGDRGWLAKVRPMYGHNYHFHIRMGCRRGESLCREQDAPPAGDGCDASLAWWFSDAVLHPKKPAKPAKPRPPLTLAGLPNECRQVLAEP
jgi:penicillin-insensitive murein endopeptidase